MSAADLEGPRPAHSSVGAAAARPESQVERPLSDAPEEELIERVKQGDESAFVALVERHGGAMLRFARLYTPDEGLAEDVVQEAWVGALRGLTRYQARASLRTWLCRIVLNRLRTRLKRERQLIPFSTLFELSSAAAEPAIPAERFLPPEHPRWPGHWQSPPQSWGDSPEERVLASETREVIDRAVNGLPPAQREVITLRDVEGWPAEEVCSTLGISESNQRVLLHRARAKVRKALESYLA